MEVISYAKYLASPQYRKFPFKGLAGWIVGNFPPSVEDLQHKYNFTYYSTMGKAVTDVNNGTLANADANQNTAVAGVYTDKDGGKNVVLLKDTTEVATMSPSVDMTINLGGHKLTTTADTCINLTSSNLAIDGRLEGSGIEKSNTGSSTGVLVKTAAGTALVVKGGLYSVSTNGTSCMPFQLGGKADVSDAVMIATETTRGGAGLHILAGGDATVSHCAISSSRSGKGVTYAASGVINQGMARISSCNIRAYNTGNEGIARGVNNIGTATITNCDIRAYSNYHKSGAGYAAYSTGVINVGTLTINDCYVDGTVEGLGNHGTLYVNGGTYESYGHGGIYFYGTVATAYVRNATLKDSLTMPDGYTATSQHNGAGFYIGGADNITVYMDNCKIYGSASQIVLRGSSGEQNNTLKISNSNLYDLDGDYLSVRIDNDTHKLYIGKGCNFTAENTTLPSAVIATDEVYVQGVA